MEPIQYKQLLPGKSKAHLIKFSDGNDYVVKFLQEGFEKSLANEWVAYCLGRYLGVPIPFARLIELPQEFLQQIPDFDEPLLSTTQFASLYIPDCKDGHEVTTISTITNHDQLASIIVFDYWLQNRDRTRKNILLKETGPDTFQLYAIDHAEVFNSYNWQVEELSSLPAKIIKSATHELMAQFVENDDLYFEAINIMKKMPILLIDETVKLLPEDWNISRKDRKKMVESLIKRRKNQVTKMINSFLNKQVKYEN